jgi:phosphoribosylformylglycinamidine synthase
VGANITIPAAMDPFVFLFSESTARAIVTVDPDRVDMVMATAAVLGVPVSTIGTVGEPGADLRIEGAAVVSVSLAELKDASEATLPALFG